MSSETPVGHIVLCGLGELGFRTLEELRRLGDEVVVVAQSPDEELAAGAHRLGARLLAGNYRQESVLRAAGVPSAAAIVITEDDDVGNLHAALAAQDLNPSIRITLRMFNEELGQRVQKLFRYSRVVDAAALAAPAFVSAALFRDSRQRIDVHGRVLHVSEARADDPDMLMPLARLLPDGAVQVFPDPADAPGDAVLSLTARDAPDHTSGFRRFRRPRRVRIGRMARSVWAVLKSSDRRLRYLAAVLGTLLVLSIVIFDVFAGLDLVDAIYFAVTIITTTGFGDISLRGAGAALQLYAVGLMLFGAASLAVFFALVTDLVIGARLARALGAVPRSVSDHIVVCGLGNIGYRVVEQLVRMGIAVVAAEANEGSRFIRTVRRLGVPVVLADARLTETQGALRVHEARALIVVTNDDLANLEAALSARALNPNLRVVLRLFDPDLAVRVERAFGIHISRSPSALVAPAFAASAEGQHVLATIPIGVSALIVAETRVEPGSPAEGETIDRLEQLAEARVLLVDSDGRPEWRPEGTTVIGAGDELVVVATRRGLARVLQHTERAAQPAAS